jgi:hypothetical protein
VTGGIQVSVHQATWQEVPDGSIVAVYGIADKNFEATALALASQLAQAIREESGAGPLFLLVDVSTAKVFSFERDRLAKGGTS